MSETRFQLACAIAPSGPAIIFIASGFLTQSFQWNFLIVGLALIFGYIGLFIFGLPLVSFLQRRSLLNLQILSICGATFGIFVFHFCLFLTGALLGSSTTPEIKSSLWGAVFGLVVALAFGLIAGITITSKGTAKRYRVPRVQ